MRNIITIAGFLGSGKSTAAKRVASSLAYQHYSGGDFMRALAQERGITLRELGDLAEHDDSIDIEIDGKQKEFMDSHDNFVIDSRLGWFLAPDSFKVFLSLDLDTASERIFADKQNNPNRTSEQMLQTLEDVKKSIVIRLDNERARYLKYYQIADHLDPSHFDLVIDTKANGIEAVAQMIVDGYEKWRREKSVL